jgi:hypothetical protein
MNLHRQPDWQRALGQYVEIRLGGQTVRAGTVEAVTQTTRFCGLPPAESSRDKWWNEPVAAKFTVGTLGTHLITRTPLWLLRKCGYPNSWCSTARGHSARKPHWLMVDVGKAEACTSSRASRSSNLVTAVLACGALVDFTASRDRSWDSLTSERSSS